MNLLRNGTREGILAQAHIYSVDQGIQVWRNGTCELIIIEIKNEKFTASPYIGNISSQQVLVETKRSKFGELTKLVRNCSGKLIRPDEKVTQRPKLSQFGNDGTRKKIVLQVDLA